MRDIKVDKIVPMNIIFPLRGEGENQEVLLGIKTRKIGVGLFNGYGGKVDEGDTMTESAAKELEKESGLSCRPEDFVKVAVVDFYIHKDDGRIVLNQCDIFLISKFEGTAEKTVEMENPTWFPINELPLGKMMIDASNWIPHILHGNKIYVQIHYNENRTEILKPVFRKQLSEN